LGAHIWPGGSRSFQLRYGSVMRPMRLSELREGDVPFVDFGTPWAQEGHIAFCLEDGPKAMVLQSFATSCSTLEPGLNADFTAAQSHDGGYYTHYVPAREDLGPVARLPRPRIDEDHPRTPEPTSGA
jgi:hypothetical protein